MSPSIRSVTPLGQDAEAARERFLGHPSSWLPEARPAGRADAWTITVRGAGVEHAVLCTVGPPWVANDVVWRRLAWTPRAGDGSDGASRWLPVLRAEMGVGREGEHAVLVVTGTYDVPLSRVGEVLDAAGLRLVARGSVSRFSDDVARVLSRTEVADHGPSEPVQLTRVPPRA